MMFCGDPLIPIIVTPLGINLIMVGMVWVNCFKGALTMKPLGVLNNAMLVKTVLREVFKHGTEDVMPLLLLSACNVITL
ncbi:hypothetical protein C5167_038847 [Papaver somniferum]|uniref:Uncharacterized protein n=1 Tax=Papaver somniferum TaxID=3469 RepID=A0A4Y7IDR8_PAPSO|nr:hypothetical protein C5167_038847 [Papaver somniferum]